MRRKWYNSKVAGILSTADRRTKNRLIKLVSFNVSELRNTPWPSDLADILEFYLLKYSRKTEQNWEKHVQMSLMDDSDVVLED